MSKNIELEAPTQFSLSCSTLARHFFIAHYDVGVEIDSVELLLTEYRDLKRSVLLLCSLITRLQALISRRVISSLSLSAFFTYARSYIVDAARTDA